MSAWLRPLVAVLVAATISAPIVAASPGASCAPSGDVALAMSEIEQLLGGRGRIVRLAPATRHAVLATLQAIEQVHNRCLGPGRVPVSLASHQPDDDNEDDDRGGAGGGDTRGDDGGPTADPTPVPMPSPTVPSTPVPAPYPAPTPGPAIPEPPPTGTPDAQLEQALRRLAAALQASNDPEMQRLGAELLGVLNGAEGPPVPGAPTVPGVPSLPSVLPSGVTLLFSDDFERGDLGKWGTCQGAGSLNGECTGLTLDGDGMGVGQDPQRGMVAQFRITDGQSSEVGGERSEVRDSSPEVVVNEGDERWYSWSMKFPADLPEPDGDWYIVMQWHAGSGSPPLAIDISQGSVDIGGDGADGPRRTIGPIRRGEWTDYVLHAGFSPGAGFVEAWENGVQTVERTARPTMSSGENYLKMGIYRDEGATGDAEVWFDDFQIFDGAGGSTAAPSTPDGPTGGRGDSDDEGSGNGGTTTPSPPAPTTPAPSPPAPGLRSTGGWHSLGAGMATNVSGAAPLPDPGSVLIARDNKQAGEDRLATVTFGGAEPTVTPVQWSGELPVDIEAVDAVPGRPGEFVTLTSGGDGHHVRLTGTAAQVLGTFTVPGGGEKYEGIALAQLGGHLVAVWADRGQAEAPATLTAAPFDLATLAFGTTTTMEFTAADLPVDARDVSDVKIDSAGRLLVTSAWEAGDDGPFDGALYDGGTVAPAASGVTLTPSTVTRPLLALDGQKVEAVVCDPTGVCVLGADNENLGGAVARIHLPGGIPHESAMADHEGAGGAPVRVTDQQSGSQ